MHDYGIAMEVYNKTYKHASKRHKKIIVGTPPNYSPTFVIFLLQYMWYDLFEGIRAQKWCPKKVPKP